MRLGLVDLLLAGGLVLVDLGLWRHSHAAAVVAGGIAGIGLGLVLARRAGANR